MSSFSRERRSAAGYLMWKAVNYVLNSTTLLRCLARKVATGCTFRPDPFSYLDCYFSRRSRMMLPTSTRANSTVTIQVAVATTGTLACLTAIPTKAHRMTSM